MDKASSVTTAYIKTPGAAPVTVYDVSRTRLYATSRTNLALQSQAFDNAAWNPQQCTVAGNADTAPDGTLTAEKFTATGSGAANPYLIPTATVTLGLGTYTISAWMKVYGTVIGKTGGIWLWNAGTGVSTPSSPPTAILAGSWVRYSVTVTVTTAGTFEPRLDVSWANVITGEQFSAWGFQIEAGFSPSSYIPTLATTASVTDYSVSGSNVVLTAAPAAGVPVSADYTYSGGLAVGSLLKADYSYVGGLGVGSTLSWSGAGSYGVWDLMVDGNMNLAVATGSNALVQDVASAIQTYSGEVYYDTTQGLPYLSEVMGQLYAPSTLRPALEQAALSVPGVLLAKAVINNFSVTARKSSGVVNITDATGESLGIYF
jgi:hypothetical protein